LTSYLGGQDAPGRGAQIAHEWRHNTREKIERGHDGMAPDLLGLAILRDLHYGLPIHTMPDGNYRGQK
jgi:hypothetical protein